MTNQCSSACVSQRDASSIPKVITVIPARFQSTRFPGKMLACETGKPLIQHVWERAMLSSISSATCIATDDARIRDAALSFGAQCIMTRSDHPNGTSRIAEAVRSTDAQVVVNVQGDEPELEPEIIDSAVRALLNDPLAQVATVVSPFHPGEDPSNPNIVKCVVGAASQALYFSRALIPHDRDGVGSRAPIQPRKHVGIYVYRREFLETFVTLSPTPLEQTEHLEQLRVLEHGFRIAVIEREVHTQGIDTPEQYAQFVARCRKAITS